MTENEFCDLIFRGGKENEVLENKVKKQGFVYFWEGDKVVKLNLISITVFPYGNFACGKWNGNGYDFVIELKWKDYEKTWFLEKINIIMIEGEYYAKKEN